MANSKRQSVLWRMQQEQKEDAHFYCGKCKRLAQQMTVDHIVPVSFLVAVGLKEEMINDQTNLQHLCRACNILKGGRFDFTDPRTLENLKRYVQTLESLYSTN